MVSFELNKATRTFQIREESLEVEGTSRFDRFSGTAYQETENRQTVDFIGSQLVALPILQERSKDDPIFIFKRWLRLMLIMRPTPAKITGESSKDTLEPAIDLSDFGSWWSGILAEAPAAYAIIIDFLQTVMPDLKDVKNPLKGADFRGLEVQFSERDRNISVPFGELSDGEKCFMICALVLAANHTYGPLLCFWDEPDNYLALQEVGDFVMELRRAFQSGGQFLMTSHNPEAIVQFSNENTLWLSRPSHLEPTQVRPLGEMQIRGDKIDALTRGEL